MIAFLRGSVGLPLDGADVDAFVVEIVERAHRTKMLHCCDDVLDRVVDFLGRGPTPEAHAK